MNARTARLRRSLAAPAVALTLAAGCGEDDCANVVCAQSACQPPFVLAVMDGSGQPVSNAQATSPGLGCTAPVTGVVSCAAGSAQATYAVEVSAPGYVAQPVQVVVGPLPPRSECGCENTCQTWQPTAVTLAPAVP